MVRGPRSRHIGPWSTDLKPRIADIVPRLNLRGSRFVDAEPGLLGLIARSETNWFEGVGRTLVGLAARSWDGDGKVAAELSFFIYGPHLVLSVILTVTYSVTSCTAPS